MSLKKSAVGLSSLCPLPTRSSSCRARGRRSSDWHAVAGSPPRHCRTYASVHHDGGHPGKPKDTDRPQWPATPTPTPYEIFAQNQNMPYNKVRFYELVKLYHPDRHCHTSHDGVPHPTKLDRYRLVVAANDILSDPEKRRMYDLYGTGWGNHMDSQYGGRPWHMASSYREADKAWRQTPGNASQNATWEDWERWYEKRDGKTRREPLFMSDGGFATVLAIFVLIGAWGQATRAGNHSAKLLDARDQKHGSISKEIHERQSEIAGLGREGRIETFLRQRESWEKVDAIRPSSK
ncbi:hypothetical protein B0H63DRAFT_183046 [Podospora didyma]|uniref:J domain-containing protein n=1 Tax=Podospora didyma TaxID=330526 RepID=A0AAE0NPS7_9PEZI|nr:hypothetical protein B0H63DRAFT_183046 [Podospora didyma]